jgi:transglutaminase-like putative cysteine protease
VNYSIQHNTIYRYEDKVSYSHHVARLTPIELPNQYGITSRIVVTPTPDILTTHRDYYGNTTTLFSLTNPHQELRIESYAELSISQPTGMLLDLSPSWESVRDRLRSSLIREDLAASEFSFASALCPTRPELAEYAKRSFRPGTPILEAAGDLNQRIHKGFSFDNSATTVSTPVMDVFEKRAGVCQDFAHLQIACLRSIGLAARYVSGYLRTDPPAGKPRLVGADASHAWVSIYIPSLGWIEYDATNNVIPSLNHIRVAYGRDYHDICPIRGTVYGGGSQTLEIGVTVTPQGA